MAMTSLTHRYLSHTHNGKRMRLKVLYRKREVFLRPPRTQKTTALQRVFGGDLDRSPRPVA